MMWTPITPSLVEKRKSQTFENLEWIEAEFNAILEPSIQDRIVALGLLGAEVDEWLKELR
jgi:hypothetical protein